MPRNVENEQKKKNGKKIESRTLRRIFSSQKNNAALCLIVRSFWHPNSIVFFKGEKCARDGWMHRKMVTTTMARHVACDCDWHFWKAEKMKKLLGEEQ